jgi:DNA-binding HxlR family transcriptional regulator
MSPNKKALAGNRPRANPVSGCPLTAALAALGGKWKLIILYWLAESPKHFAALRRAMPGISQKVLTQQLRELISDGIVRRQPKGAIPSPVVYSLTDYGRSVLPLVEDVRLWGRTHMERLTSRTDAPTGDHSRPRDAEPSKAGIRPGGLKRG